MESRCVDRCKRESSPATKALRDDFSPMRISLEYFFFFSFFFQDAKPSWIPFPFAHANINSQLEMLVLRHFEVSECNVNDNEINATTLKGTLPRTRLIRAVSRRNIHAEIILPRTEIRTRQNYSDFNPCFVYRSRGRVSTGTGGQEIGKKKNFCV
ncbi:hypothetical protein PUN28_006808 [Cardiocondyla obscurior]|uniref:Uncharacterized protein n=1 Tax=Cardiocondyla obscurior TaxID=286306 RepID=A0AAW2G0E4_9HYME